MRAFKLFVGLGVSSLAVDCLVGAEAHWSCVLVNFSQLIEDRSVKTMMLLRRLQLALNNCHPASEILMLGVEQLECTLSAERFFALHFDVFAECVDSRGHFLMVAVDLLIQFCESVVNLIKLSANGVETFLHAAAYVFYIALEFVNSTIDPLLDSAEVSG